MKPVTFESDAELRKVLRPDRDTLARLSQSAGSRLLAITLLEWTLIVATIVLSEHVGGFLFTAIAVVFIGTRQHALLMLMHEFSHRQFSRHRVWLNDAVGDTLTAIPFGITVHGFRRDHLQHHANTSTAQDPNWVSELEQTRYQFPKSGLQLAAELLKHLVGMYAWHDLRRYLFDSRIATDNPSSTRWRQAAIAITVVALTWYFNGWYVVGVYWLLPMFTVLLTLLYLRDIAEHFALPSSGVSASRSTLPGAVERWLIAPYNVGFHAEHHLFPSVPWCRLKTLHQLLTHHPSYTKKIVLTTGYLTGVLQEARRHPS